MSAKLSVVVPTCNVEDYLDACLESLAEQTLRDLEIVIVDDGSLDGSAVIAKQYASRDPRFRIIEQKNQGPGAARNNGIRHATGEYLAFADSDDVVPLNAYSLLVGSLERSGSDLACGNVYRLDGDRAWQSWLHAGVFGKTTRGTHITERPRLVRDRTVWNKVYRRSFWDAHGFTFPDGLYEDAPVAIPAHLAAGKIDVVDEVVYHWRKRSGSITDERYDLENFSQRVRTALHVRDHVAAKAPDLVPDYDEHGLVDVDLRILMEGLPRTADEDRPGLMEVGGAVLDRIGDDVLRRTPALTRLQLHLMKRRMLPELLEVLRFVRVGENKSTGVVKRGGLRPRWYAEYPYFEDAERRIPDSVYDVTDELDAVAALDDVRWSGDRLRIEGHAYIRWAGAATRDDAKIRLWLLADDKIGLKRIPIQRVARPDVTADSGQSAISYEWSGFVGEIDPADLKVFGRRRQVDWRVIAEVSAHGVKHRRALAQSRQARQKWPLQWALPDGLRVQVIPSGGLRLRVRQPGALVTGHRRVGDDVQFEGVLAQPLPGGTKLTASITRMGVKLSAPLETETRPDGTLAFRARLPLARLGDERSFAWTPSVGAAGEIWTLGLSDGTKLLLDGTEGSADARYAVPGRTPAVHFAVTRTRFDHLCGIVRAAVPVVTRVAWADGDRLVLAGDWSGGAERPAELVLRRRRSSQEQRVPITWDGDAFTAELTPSRMPRFGADIPLGRGNWHVLAATGDHEVPVVVARGSIRELPAPRTVRWHDIEIHSGKDDILQLRIRVALAPDERGGYAQKRLQVVDYPRYREQPLLDLAVFDAFSGRQASDNPRGVFDELRRRNTGMDCVWVTVDGQFPPPDGARTILQGSREHYEALARAKLIVGNWRQPDWFRKREGQTYVQCWHGSPLKKVGYDLKEMSYKRTEGADWMETDVPQWDLLVSQSPFVVPFLRSAFRYDGPIIDTGYPRNDLLNRPERHQLALDVRERLGIPAGKKVVMYAPTWRDDFHFAVGKRAFQLEFDIDAATAALGDDHVLLLRTHYLVTDKPKTGENPFVIDVSDYPDIAELYLVTDIFITDYSSSMFDFAVTGKPVLFYTYDLDRYRDHVRGFYFDFDEVAPSPLFRTSEEVIAAVRDIDALVARNADRYRAFQEKFCPHDDGRSGARILDRVLGSE
ncbi:CDP-glycerol:poly(glycerophosphate) glycerophosphotransferase [Actinomadura rubteroloni]|uniref:CDP-glycerol:poly(Glycerophosphate) glycerophosphotransferase n=1 Tax=Actinomadura rubteroloni TaxID=1926885 RepID=A0A2P4UJQ1_9ACTN|nr:bifunctional glycosyltransferase/CDP-glycerol:glycerophosphate glycerophosphotransferase [Actinomadura rubteroloni]POM25274.1 CDP-glycerol:poly(glycerophosphate) glycerophosphotransferase [Actinomadura rubteroloni]